MEFAIKIYAQVLISNNVWLLYQNWIIYLWMPPVN